VPPTVFTTPVTLNLFDNPALGELDIAVLLSIDSRESTPLAPSGKSCFLVLTKVTLVKRNEKKKVIKSSTFQGMATMVVKIRVE